MKCCWKMLLAVTLLGVISASANATTITVTSGANSGPGTLREALATLSAPGNTDTKIHITASLLTISSTLTYPDVDKQLVITASTGAVISYSGSNDIALECKDRNGCDIEDFVILNGSLFILLPDTTEISTTVKLDNVAVYDSDKTGILIDVDEDADGDITVDLDNVTTDGNATQVNNDYVGPGGAANRFPNGVLVFDDHIGGELRFEASNCEFCENKRAGVKVDRDAGDLTAVVLSCDVFGNINDFSPGGGGDGLQFEQSGNGDCVVAVGNSDLWDNEEDDIEVEESGDGDCVATLFSLTCDNSADEAIHVTEENDGDLDAELSYIDVCDCDGDAYKFGETGEGTFTVDMLSCDTVDADLNGVAAGSDGVQLEPDGDDTVTVLLTSCNINDCDDEGVQFSPLAGSTSGCSITLDDCEVMDNAVKGIKVEATSNNPTAWVLDIDDPIADIGNYQGNGTSSANDLDTDPNSSYWTLNGLAGSL